MLLTIVLATSSFLSGISIERMSFPKMLGNAGLKNSSFSAVVLVSIFLFAYFVFHQDKTKYSNLEMWTITKVAWMVIFRTNFVGK